LELVFKRNFYGIGFCYTQSLNFVSIIATPNAMRGKFKQTK